MRQLKGFQRRLLNLSVSRELKSLPPAINEAKIPAGDWLSAGCREAVESWPGNLLFAGLRVASFNPEHFENVRQGRSFSIVSGLHQCHTLTRTDGCSSSRCSSGIIGDIRRVHTRLRPALAADPLQQSTYRPSYAVLEADARVCGRVPRRRSPLCTADNLT